MKTANDALVQMEVEDNFPRNNVIVNFLFVNFLCVSTISGDLSLVANDIVNIFALCQTNAQNSLQPCMFETLILKEILDI